MNTLAGHPLDFIRFRREFSQEFTRCVRDSKVSDASAPSLSRTKSAAIMRAFAEDPAYTSLHYRSRDIRVSLISFVDGKDIQGGSSLVDDIAEILFHGRLDWYIPLHSIQDQFASPAAVVLGSNRPAGLRSFLR